MPFRLQVRNRIHHIDIVRGYRSDGNEIATTGLIGLIFGLMSPNMSLIDEKVKLPERMKGLSFVKLVMSAGSTDVGKVC
jgi:hypothetical protein